VDIEKEVKTIIAEELGVKPEEIKLESSLIDDLGADSLEAMEVLMQLEEELGVKIADEDIEKMTTVGDIVKYVKEKKGLK